VSFDPFKIYKFEFNDEGSFDSCMIPKKLETCPCCDSRLVARCEGWEKGDDDPFWIPVDIQIDCIRDEDNLRCYREHENSEIWRMPYVYWLPVSEHCRSWITRMLRIYHEIDPVPLRWLEKNGQQNLFGNRYSTLSSQSAR
jgi:hypothetical protein